MKIANITEEGRWGGPQKYIVDVSSKFDRHEVQAFVIYPVKDSKRLEKELVVKGIKNKKIELQRLSKHLPSLFRYVASFFFDVTRLYKLLKALEPDIVHCRGSWQIKGVISARLANIDIVWTLNDTYVPRVVKSVFNFFAAYANGFITVSERTRKYYLENTKLSIKPAKVIQAPVNTEDFMPDKIKPNLEIANYSGLKVVTVASINPVKGIESFIKMAEIVTLNTQLGVNFFIIGPVPESQRKYGKYLKSLVSKSGLKNIHFWGSSNKVSSILKAADLYVCSSKFEASPIAVWEAMAMKLPVISTNVGDLKHFLERPDTPAGAVVKVDNVNGLAEEVRLYLENEPLRIQAGHNGRHIVKSELDLEICAQEHVNFYKKILNKNLD